MSTRGSIGVRINGVDKLAYNHSDSYPEYLGKHVVQAIRKIGKTSEKLMPTWALKLETYDPEVKPTEAQKQVCRDLGIVNLGVSEQSEDDWYCLTREAQGDVEALLSGKLPFVNKNDATFVRDSLFCEYAYIVNFDSGKLEFYKGFNKDASAAGRYAALDDGVNQGYKGVALLAEYPLDEIINRKDFKADRYVSSMKAAVKAVRETEEA